MKAHSGITLTPSDVDYVYGALAAFADGMTKYAQWIRTKEGKPLPGMETAIQEINKDLVDIVSLQQRVYDGCFVP